MCVTHVGKQGALLHTVIQGPRQWRLCHLVATPSRAQSSLTTKGGEKDTAELHMGLSLFQPE